MHIILFEDESVRQLYPVTLARPAFLVLCGGYRLIDLASRLEGELRAIVRSHLLGILGADQPVLLAPYEGPRQLRLYINARMVPSVKVIEQLKALITAGQPVVVRSGAGVAAVLIGPGQEPPPIHGTIYELSAWSTNSSLSQPQWNCRFWNIPMN